MFHVFTDLFCLACTRVLSFYHNIIFSGPNPCPSAECWTHDASTNTCTIKAECATLTCGATAFDITFKSALFNLDDNQSIVTMAGGMISPV